jgi:hypothetical protein
MARKKAINKTQFPPFSPDLQLQFWARLQQIRNKYLSDALSQTIKDLDITKLDGELAVFVGSARLAAVAAYSLRGETFFPVPYLLRTKPMLLGYYRLLYGLSQKEFYKHPFGRFRAMEENNQLSTENEHLLSPLCRSLGETAWQLLSGIQPLSTATIHELQLLTVGPQLRGSRNVTIGQGATARVFELVRDLLSNHIESSTKTVITVKNASGRIVQIAFASDPDITIIETLPSGAIPSVSIEIKGGADISNVHNRIGEAEKSHQKAKAAGFTSFWTILKARITDTAAKRGSPTTNVFFNLDEILKAGTAQHSQFRDLLYHTIGVG